MICDELWGHLCAYDLDDDAPTPRGDDRFADSEAFRAVLVRICDTPDGWRTDPDADQLIRYAADRFTQLAQKHGLEPDDAMSATFEALRNPSVRFGRDPWGVMVTSMATTFRAWQFAEEALTSLETARRGELSGCRAERFCERDLPVWEHDPAFAVTTDHDPQPPCEGLSVREQAEALAVLFTMHGWPAAQVTSAIEIVMRKLADAGSRPRAYEALRREPRWRAFTGLPAKSWTGLLRLLLGAPVAASPLGQGILLRQAFGETLAHLAGDTDLIKAIRDTKPGRSN